MTTTFNKQKLKELILHIAGKLAAHDDLFGKVKLNKILFFSDFAYFRASGQSITGATYIRKPNGPVVSQLMPVLEEMETDGEAYVWTRPKQTATDGEQKRVLNLRPADVSSFLPAEIALVDDVIDILRDQSANTLSDLAHRSPGWRLADDGEEIPFYTAYISDDPIVLSSAAKEMGRSLASRLEATTS